MMRKVMITGGHGFIGSNLIWHWLGAYPSDFIINLDAVTYAARPEYLRPAAQDPAIAKRYSHILGDIRNRASLSDMMRRVRPDHVIHLAAESHVCRSIAGPEAFYTTNVMGTFNLLEEFRQLWGDSLADHRFLHVSTDEVFGDLAISGRREFHEHHPIEPTSPYAASKAASDLAVMAYCHTYGMNAVVTNCSNNYGPNQHDEKLVPRSIKSILSGQVMTLYGDGTQIRDWIHVRDHCRAIDTVFHYGKSGDRYCVGGDQPKTNLDILDSIRRSVERVTGEKMIMRWEHTDGRPTDDWHYEVNSDKLKALGWSQTIGLEAGLDETVRWYQDNRG